MDDRHVLEIEGPAYGPLVIPGLLRRGSGLLRVLLHPVRPRLITTALQKESPQPPPYSEARSAQGQAGAPHTSLDTHSSLEETHKTHPQRRTSRSFEAEPPWRRSSRRLQRC